MGSLTDFKANTLSKLDGCPAAGSQLRYEHGPRQPQHRSVPTTDGESRDAHSARNLQAAGIMGRLRSSTSKQKFAHL